MVQQAHPTTDRLARYVECPEAAEYDDVQLHLVACHQCRHKVDGLQNTYNTLASDGFISQRTAPIVQASPEHLSAHQMKAYTSNALSQQDRESIKRHLKACSDCKKQLLHFAAHQAAGNDKLGDHQWVKDRGDLITDRGSLISASPTTVAARTSLSHWLGDKWVLWFGLPATVLASVLLTVGLMSAYQYQSNDTALIAAVYQDQPVLWITPVQVEQHGIGFFNSAESTTTAYHGVKVSIDTQGNVHFKWPPIEGAESYALSLYITTDDGSMLLEQTTVHRAAAIIAAQSPLVGSRYEWELSGSTKESKFRTKGGFVVAKPQ